MVLLLHLVEVVVEQVHLVDLEVLVEMVGIQYYHHLLMELLDHLHQLQYTDTLLAAAVVFFLLLGLRQSQVVLVVVVLDLIPPPSQELRELQTLVVVEEEELMQMVVLVVLESSLFNIQNKEVKYGTLCTDWL
jgi:hypothetical protein